MKKVSDPLVKDGLGILIRMILFAVLLGILGTLLQGCSDQCETSYTYTEYHPVTVAMEEVKASVAVEEPRQLVQPGKIYMKDHYIFISEAGAGIHIIDNSDKTNPVFKSFVNIPGSFDMAVLGNILYTDSYTDLLAFDIADVENVTQVGEVEGVFESRASHYYYHTQNNELVVGYEPVLVERDYQGDCDDEIYGSPVNADFERRMDGGVSPAYSGGSGGEVVNQAGQGGSMARFTLQANHLYALDASNVYVFDLANPFTPTELGKVTLDWNIETIFPYEDKLFIGSSNGLHILDNSNPAMPVYAASFGHASACDPVVVENDIAYVTLRSGNECAGFVNQLDVLDVSDIYNPDLLVSYTMENPHGLGIDKGTLFLCEGEFGLKVFDAEDIYKIGENLLEHRRDIHAFDVIPYQEVLLLIGEDGFYQYDYSDINNLRLLSHIAISPANN